VRDLLQSSRAYFANAAIFSFAINLLYLAGPLFMIQISDRVLTSGSETTLVMLLILVLISYGTLAALDFLRAQLLARGATHLDAILASRLFGLSMSPLPSGPDRPGQPIRDLETMRSFISAPTIHAIFDLPWTPVYILIIYRLHAMLGFFSLICAVILFLMALLNEVLVRAGSGEAARCTSAVQTLGDQCLRNRESVFAMGMLFDLTNIWMAARRNHLAAQLRAAERSAAISATVKFMRMAMQSGVLAVGAWLVIERATTAGAMFAASILLGRALQPVEQAAASYRSFASAIDALRRLYPMLLRADGAPRRSSGARLRGDLKIDNLTYSLAGSANPIINNISFTADAGDVIGIIGASGAGKSTLAKLIVGVLAPTAGQVAICGTQIGPASDEANRRCIGYLPQNIELFDDTVAANIARFRIADSAQVVRAAKMAGIDGMVQTLPQGYRTMIGRHGVVFSGGWLQRVALARAAFGEPGLVVLDEPNSNLDETGEASLAKCIDQLRLQKTTVIVISHRPAMLRVVDKILIMKGGRIDWFGPRDELLRGVVRNSARAAAAH